MNTKMNPVHPGDALLEEFLKPIGLNQNQLAIEIGVDARRILARYFGTSPQFWLSLQSEYGLEVAMDRLGTRLKREVRLLADVR